mgnify:CR=1 FL=1
MGPPSSTPRDTRAVSVPCPFAPAAAGGRAGVAPAVATCDPARGGVDIAYLNAGIALGVSEMPELTDADYSRIMRVNVDGVVWGARAEALYQLFAGLGGAAKVCSGIIKLLDGSWR